MSLAVRPSRTIRAAGYLAILLGIAGTISGFAAAPTFIPFRNASTFNGQFVELFTVLAAAGGATSILGILGGRSLVQGQGRAWRAVLGVALASVALNAVFAALWPGYVAFLVLVGVAYGLVVLLLLLVHGRFRVLEIPGSMV